MRRRVGLFVVATSVLVLAGAGARAEAHALLVSSVPAAGATVDAPPPAVSLTFTETPDPALTVVHVLDARGASVERGKPRPSGQPQTVAIDLRSLDRGVYTVTWRTTSSVDGHTTAGSFSFGVGVSPPAATAATTKGPTTPRPSPLSVAGRWAFYAGLVTLVGAGSTALLVTRRALPGRRWPLGLAGLGAVGLAAMAVDLRQKAGVPFSKLLGTTTGHKLALEGAAVLVVLMVAAAVTRRPRRATTVVLAVAASLAMLARAGAGHAGAASPAWLAIGLQWIHLVAVGVWVGGFVWLLVALRENRREPGIEMARRFSGVAAWSLLVVVATGTLRGLDEVGAWSRLFDTSFGQTLVVKVALVLVIVALGSWNRFRHLRSPNDGAQPRLARVIGAEAVFGAAVLVATAILAGLPPSKSVADSTAGAGRRVVQGSDYATTVRARLTLTPGGVGANRFELELRDYDQDTPVDATAVSLRAHSGDRADVPPSTLGLSRTGPGRWRGDGSALAFPGTWRITVVVERPEGSVTIPLTLRLPEPPQRVSAVRTPGLPTIYTITTSAGERVQGYVDPGRTGANEVHVTFLAADGAERPVSDVTIEAGPRRGRRSPLTNRRLGPGHFVGDATLRPGEWVFAFRGSTAEGAVVAGSFSETIPR